MRLLQTVLVTTAPLALIGVTQTFPANFLNCLQNICGDPNSYLVTPSFPTYNSDRVGFNINFNYKPIAIYHPATEHDAAAAIRCAAANNVAIAPRSGGHSFEGYGQGGKDGSLIIDLNQFQQFSIDKQTHVATVGAGTRLGPLYSRLWKAGEYLVPAGTCPSVGVGGHALGGGIGMVSRKYGVLTDSIVGMKMLDATGTTRHINGTSDADLFWALRGAGGGSFGLVTEFQIQAYMAPKEVTTMVYTFPLSQYRSVVEAYVQWGKSATEDIFGHMSVRSSRIELRLTFLGSQSQAQEAVASLLEGMGPPPTKADIRESNWYQAASQWAGGSEFLENPNLNAHRYHRGGSLVYRQPLSLKEIDVLYKYLSRPPRGSTSAYVVIEIWGGQMDRAPSPASFDNHRGVYCGLDFGIAWNNPRNKPGTTCHTCLQWSREFKNELYDIYSSGPSEVEGYQNYIERDMPNWQKAYYGDNIDRLQYIKRTVDPNNVFSFPQSIPLS